MVPYKHLMPVSLLLVLFQASVINMYEMFHVKEGKFFQLVQDPQTHDIYIGGRNRIYHLDSTLKLKQEVTVGPIKDNPKCLPRTKCKKESFRDNDIVVLAIEPLHRFLFACGTVEQGTCTSYDLANFKKSTRFLAHKAENFVGSSSSSIAFFELDPVSNTSILYVAMSYDGRKIEAFPKAISERIMTKTASGLYNLSYRKNYLVIPSDKSMLSTYPIKYIYGFKLHHFIYYVSLHKNKTYIGRVCENSKFYYYVEIPLKCWPDDEAMSYATSARLIGDDLFVTYWDKVKEKSVFCNHPMKEIQRTILNTIKECYSRSGVETPRSPIWINGNKLCTETLSESVEDDTCGLDEANGYISGLADVSIAKFSYKRKFTAIQHYRLDRTDIYLLGTSDGHLLKLIKHDARDQQSKAMLMMNIDLSNGTGHAIEPDLEIDGNKTHVYAISGSTVTRFPLKSCSVYTNCSTCVTTMDPLNCGWCHDKCTSRSECTNGWSPDCCVPQITSISPTKGPVEGGTRLTIRGNYFANGNPDRQITVRVGSAACSLDDKSNSTTIFCKTKKDINVKKGNIHVKISAESIDPNQPKIDGEGRSKEIFYFMVPEIFNFTPTYGPISGGTNCNITGKNLDIGSSVHLYIKDEEVSIKRRTQDKIFALTKKVSREIEAPLKLDIDGQILQTKDSYRYTPDPIIMQTERGRHTIKSGGIDIVFIGQYLNTVQKPMLSGNIVMTGASLPAEKCVSNEKGTELLCKTPPLVGNWTKMVPVDLRLEMDGVEALYDLGKTHPEKSRIQYQSDPVLHKFDSKNHVYFYGKDTKYVEIKGDRINDVIQKKDINITIGYSSCEITSLTNRAIFCKPSSIPENSTDHQKFQVLIKIGFRMYNIGWCVFASSSLAQVNISIIVLIVILILIFVVIAVLIYCLWKKKLLFFKEKTSLPAARYTANDQVHFGENGRLIINSNEYTERQNFLPVTTVGNGAMSYPVIDESILLVLGDKKLLIPKEALQITDKIGQGHFGCVYRALYRKPGEKGEMLVAVKTLHKDHPRDMDIQGFLDEALIMKDFDHDNILSLIGICLGKDHMPLVVLPYMAHGDLLSYLRNVDNQPTVKDLIVFGISIASGMDYLASLKFVHRDLAARNCMLNDKLVVKVADFGLSRDIYERDYYSSDNKKSKLPVKWMALESLENGTYNTKTDVWSYGVVLWELFTRGVNPYPTVDNWDMPKYLKLGRRMDKPDYCPNRIYDIMLCCWEFDQNLRPDFATIFKELTELSEMERHRDLPCYQKTPYENVEC